MIIQLQVQGSLYLSLKTLRLMSKKMTRSLVITRWMRLKQRGRWSCSAPRFKRKSTRGRASGLRSTATSARQMVKCRLLTSHMTATNIAPDVQVNGQCMFYDHPSVCAHTLTTCCASQRAVWVITSWNEESTHHVMMCRFEGKCIEMLHLCNRNRIPWLCNNHRWHQAPPKWYRLSLHRHHHRMLNNSLNSWVWTSTTEISG